MDCRGVVGDGRWHDELHPTDAGYADVGQLFKAEIKRLTAVRAAPAAKRKAKAPPAPARARSRARAATAPEAAAAKGYSLHVGLNFVDPKHYEGWDGELAACEFDAADMAELAAAIGYEAQTLIREAATRDAVLGAIRANAARMKAGDVFVLTYSGHGGQVPDFSGDEAADDAGDVADETLCLFDGQLIDDELYAAWAAFPADTPGAGDRRLLPLRLERQGGDDPAAARRRPRPRVPPAGHAARRRRAGGPAQPRLLPPRRRRGGQGLDRRPRDPRDGAAGGGERAADLGLPGQPGGARRALKRALHRPPARGLGRGRLPGRLRRLPPRDPRPHARDPGPESLPHRPAQPRLRRQRPFDIYRPETRGRAAPPSG